MADQPAALGVLSAACVSALVVNANTSAVTILLPSISEDVCAPVAQLQWAVTGYSLVGAAVIVTSGALGDDGGAVCENPANALGKATLLDQISNGASFVGRRPVIFDRRFVLGEALILQIYCPDKRQAYQKKIDELKYDDTVKP